VITVKISLRSFWLPKAGNSITEYEDAFWPQSEGEHAGSTVQFAVADGATESSFSRLWARMLVMAFCNLATFSWPSQKRIQDCVTKYGQRWVKNITQKPLPWFVQNKVQQGAFASLTGLQLNTSSKTWQVLAIGDSCLFHVRGTDLLTSFPVKKADEFGYHPLLLSVRPEKNNLIWEKYDQLVAAISTFQSGDNFFLMTDALAHWFLTRVEAKETPWLTLLNLTNQQDFELWVSEMRYTQQLHNDDITLLLIKVENDF